MRDAERTVRAWLDAINAHDVRPARGRWAETIAAHVAGVPEPISDFWELERLLDGFWSAIPDLHSSIDDIVVDGDRVVVRATTRGTHRGTLLGVAATGRSVRFSGFAAYRLTPDGRIAEEWLLDDLLSLLGQIQAEDAVE